jgi:AbrB family looped-hinge helix DNA binding protein
MKSTMDSAGRLVIPKDIRREAGIRPGMPLDVRVREGRIEIEPAPLTVRLEKRGRFLIAVPEEQVPVLTSEDVEATRDKLRRERVGK